MKHDNGNQLDSSFEHMPKIKPLTQAKKLKRKLKAQ